MMAADKFNREYDREQAVAAQDAARAVETNDVLREALREAWHIFDMLGAHQSDDQRIAIIHSHEFASAAYRVRAAMLKTARKT